MHEVPYLTETSDSIDISSSMLSEIEDDKKPKGVVSARAVSVTANTTHSTPPVSKVLIFGSLFLIFTVGAYTTFKIVHPSKPQLEE